MCGLGTRDTLTRISKIPGGNHCSKQCHHHIFNHRDFNNGEDQRNKHGEGV